MPEQQVEKAIATINDTLNPVPTQPPKGDDPRRGVQVYTMSQLMAVTGRTKSGEMMTGHYDQSLFFLNYDERIAIFRLCSPVFAVVSNRMNVISTMEFEVVADKTQEDRLAQRLKNLKAMCDEFKNATEPKYIIARASLLREIMDTLPDVLPDLSNFNTSLLRWKKRIQDQNVDQGEYIKEWMLTPNINDRFEEFVKKLVFDLLVHGCIAVYKENLNDRVENIYCLPGGTVIPLKNKFVGGINAYVQVTNSGEEPKIYFGDELSYANYIPSSARAYGFIPMEALINKLAADMMFDKYMADRADGTAEPEKLVVITDRNPYGDLSEPDDVPIDSAEQKRIETKLNTPKKGKIITFSGYQATVVDLSKADTLPTQMQYVKDVRETVGLVFQATPMEMNLAGGENTSGRSTSEAQREIYHSRGVQPILKIIQNLYNREILPYRFGSNWKMEFQSGKDEGEELDILQKKVALGLYSPNELRQDELNLSPFQGEEYDKPTGTAPAPGQSQPGGIGGLL